MTGGEVIAIEHLPREIGKGKGDRHLGLREEYANFLENLDVRLAQYKHCLSVARCAHMQKQPAQIMMRDNAGKFSLLLLGLARAAELQMGNIDSGNMGPRFGGESLPVQDNVCEQR